MTTVPPEEMDAEELQTQVEHFHSKGYCLFEDLFSSHDIDGLKETSMRHFEEIQNIIANSGQRLGIGIKEGFDEIVQRHEGRYEMPYKMNDIFKNVSQSPILMQIVHAILGPDVVVANESLIVSMPGTLDQSWHSDGPHMSVTEHLPAHVLNVFIPLVDVDTMVGPTEFRPGSHYMTRDLKKMFLLAAMKKQLLPNTKPTFKKGSALLFDYRVLHRGTANKTEFPRPVYVLTFGKSWYKDTLNFPHRSVFAPTRETLSNSDNNNCQQNLDKNDHHS